MPTTATAAALYRGIGFFSANQTARLKIKGIPIEDDLLLDWDIGFCSNDPAYLKYGKFEELILSTDPKNEYVTYEELYEV